jgi:hypothetical protein
MAGGALPEGRAAAVPPWPEDGGVERSWGVNIHFTQAEPGELEMLAASGAQRARTDFSWADTEKQPGQYDFSAYEQLADALAAQGVRPWFILDYENPLYETTRAVMTDAGRAAFANWAAAAAKDFRGRNVIWEIWNEPNNAHFWQPQPDPHAYTALALAATRAIQAADPDAVVVGPAAALVDSNFLRVCGEAGLFSLWKAVTVHPYRRDEPETAAADFQQARALVRRYTPAGQLPPVLLAGEWGYSTAWPEIDEDLQAAYVARMELADLAEGVPLTIWYDWRDDGTDLRDPEQNFGLVRQAYHEGATPVFYPKPAYEAAAALARELRFYRLNKALTQDAGHAHLLLFERRPGAPEELPPFKLAVWTTHPDGHETVAIPIGPGRFLRVDGRGRVMMDAATTQPSLEMQVTSLPQYLTPTEVSPRLALLAAWERWPLEYLIAPGTGAVAQTTWKNPLADVQELTPQMDPPMTDATGNMEITLYPAQSYTQTSALVPLLANGAPMRVRAGMEGWWQETWLTPARTLDFDMTPLSDQGLSISLPGMSGGLLVVHAGMDALSAQAAKDATPSVVVPARDFTSAYGVEVSALLTDSAGRLVAQQDFGRVTRMTLPQGRPGSPSGLRTVPEGGPYTSGDATCRWDNSPSGVAGAPAPMALRVDYSSGQGARFYRFEPGDPMSLAEWPQRVGFWVYGDDTPVRLTLRLQDVTGQTFQPWPVQVTGRHWQEVWIDLDPARCDHWGAMNDGKPIAPLAWDCYFIVDKTSEEPAKGTVFLLPPTIIYKPQQY